MSVVEFLSHLADLDIRLWVEGENLRFSAPEGAFTPEIKQQVIDRKLELIEFLGQAKKATQEQIPQAPRDGDLPLSYAQQRLWFLHQLAPEDTSYNMPAALRIKGDLRIDVLQQAINEILRRHEMLRTTFYEIDGDAFQQVNPAQEYELLVEDISGNSDAQATLADIALQEAFAPFDLAESILRIRLIRLGEDEYALLSTMHHIASDGWSMGILVTEIATLYRAFSQNQPSPFPDLQIQYADFAHWQKQHLNDEKLEQQLAFWKDHLANPPVLQIPSDRPRPAVVCNEGDFFEFTLGTDIANGVRELSRQHNATLFMTLFAAYNVLLYRYSLQDDICVGTPIVNRDNTALEPLIGCFINTLAIRTDLSGNPGFVELLQAVTATSNQCFENKDIPFEHVVDKLVTKRDLSTTPLFQTMFILQNAPSDRTVTLPGVHLEPIEVGKRVAKYDIMFTLMEHGTEIECSFEYRTSLFDRSTIERFATHFTHLLKQIISDPEQAIATIQLTTPEEREQLLSTENGAWNATQVVYPGQGPTLHAMFEAQVAKTPDAIAVKDARSQLSYQQLNEQANQLAHYLIDQHGIGPDAMVGVAMERSVHMSVALLAVLKAGGAYVPFDPSFPAERLGFMCEDTQVSVILSQQHLLSTLEEKQLSHKATILYVDSSDAWRNKRSADPQVAVNTDHLFNVIFTSGSTGKPKGVMVPHRGIINRLLWMQAEYPLTADDHVLQKTPYSFDVSVWELFWPLLVGAQIVYAKPEGHKDPDYLRDLIIDAQISTLHFVPSMLGLFLQTENIENCRCIRQTFCSGEALQLEHERRFFQRLPHARLHNLYGPTEASVDVSYFECRSDSDYRSVPIGKPVANTQLHILDESLQPVPVGVIGELYIGGVQLARGYLNREELTAKTFIANPYFKGEEGGGHPSPRLYKTGDLARYQADGNIEYIGRTDFQVKVRGLRIELGEIESVLHRHEAVKETIVVTKEIAPGNVLIIAYIVAGNPHYTPDLTALRAHLSANVPEYMVPNAFVFIDEIPLSANGKANRRALPEPDLEQLSGKEYVAPRTATEQTIAQIWSEILGIEKIGIHDNFFELGGHSLLVTRVLARIKKVFNKDIALRQLFEVESVADLAALIDDNTSAAVTTPRITVIPRDTIQPGDLRLSFAQQRLWMVDNILKGSPMYNMPMAWRINGRLNQAALQQALNSIIERHDILRTTFSQQKLQPYQIVHPFSAIELPLRDVSTAELEGTLAELSLQPFDLAAGPLIRCELLRLGEDQHVLLVNMHHIVSDGWSLSVFTNELLSLYQAFTAGAENPLTPLPLQYADYANWQHDYLSGERLEQQIHYWQQQLSHLPVLQLPSDHARPPAMTAEGFLYNFAIDAELGDRLRAFSQQHNITLFMLLLGAFNVLLYRYSGQDDFAIGTPIANREQQEVEALIGLFVNTLVLRTPIDAQESFVDYLQRVRQTTLDAYQHQDAPFEKVVEALSLARDMSHTPLFQVMFSLLSSQQGQNSSAQLANLEIAPLFSESNNTDSQCVATVVKFDLQMGVTDQGAGKPLLASIEGRQALFDQHTFARLANHFTNLLEQALSTPERSLGTLNLTTEVEKQQLLATTGDAWNATSVHYTDVPTIHALFEAQVDKTPDAIAVSDEQHRLSYRELNEQANQLAHHLICRGIGPDSMVGVAMERCVDMSVALLAVLKAGGAYVPFDPSFPAERLAYMAEDTRLSILLSQQHIVARDDVNLPGNAAVLCIDNRSNWQNQPRTNPHVVQSGDQLFNVIFTSGSTGKPKGVMVPHHGIINRLLWMQDEYPLNADDRVLQKTPYSFDVSVWELFWPLLVGAQIVYARPDGHKDPDYLRDTINSAAITTLHFVPSMLGMFLQAKDVESCQSIRRTFCSGEALQLEHERRFFQRLPHAELHNLYGPTEASVDVSYFACQPNSNYRSVPIGKPVANTQLHILDDSLQPVPVGIIGELYIGGIQLARGYLNREELTRNTFIDNPYHQHGHPSARLYKTGDLVRYRPDGNIEYIGRSDFQVKVRGLRIELGEIESVLHRHDAVKETIVVTKELAPGNVLIVAYLVAQTEQQPPLSELRSHLAANLPEYMIPNAFVFIDEIPLSANGKANRRALPDPDLDQLRGNEYVAPRSETEQQLAVIWSSVLGIEKVGVQDNFFELGGHSILAMQAANEAHETFQVEIELAKIFETPTIEKIAGLIDQALAEQSILMNNDFSDDDNGSDDDEELVI